MDKTGDILDSAEAGRLFDDLYAHAILHPDDADEAVNRAVERLREEGREHRRAVSLLGTTNNLDPREAKRLLDHPLPHWVERMTTSYLQARGGRAEQREGAWKLRWPEEEEDVFVVFSLRDAARKPSTWHLTLAEDRVRRLATRIPSSLSGTPIPILRLETVPREVHGVWSLWRIGLEAPGWRRERILPLFVHDDGRVLPTSAQVVWDRFLEGSTAVTGCLAEEKSAEVFTRTEVRARDQGRHLYEELLMAHRAYLERERETGEFAFEARRRTIEQLGLRSVREHRLSKLRADEEAWRRSLAKEATTVPELDPILLARVEGGRPHG